MAVRLNLEFHNNFRMEIQKDTAANKKRSSSGIIVESKWSDSAVKL